MDVTLAFIQNIGPLQWLIILAVGLLLFGRRLPEVGRSLGRAIVEFKKGLKGIDDEADEAAERSRSADPHSLPQPPSDPRRVSASERIEESA